MTPPEPENSAKVAALARWLGQSLSRELCRLEGIGPVSPKMKEFYDGVYLPRLIALAKQVDRRVAFEDMPLLYQPLHPDLAATQIRFVLELLELIVKAL